MGRMDRIGIGCGRAVAFGPRRLTASCARARVSRGRGAAWQRIAKWPDYYNTGFFLARGTLRGASWYAVKS